MRLFAGFAVLCVFALRIHPRVSIVGKKRANPQPSDPGLENKFRFPNSRSDQALIAAARAFASDAEPLKDEFIRRNLPPTFIDDLKERTAAFAGIISSRNVHAGSKVQATASIDDVLDEAMLDVRELDPAVENAIDDDKPLLESWRSARHIERHSSHKPKPTPPVPPPSEEPKSVQPLLTVMSETNKREAIARWIASLIAGIRDD